MDYGKSVVIIEDNSIFQPTWCQYTTVFLVALFSHQLFLLICGFPVTKLKETSCLSRVLDNTDFPWWLGLSHFLFLTRKEIRSILLAFLRRVWNVSWDFLCVSFLNDVRWHSSGPCFSFSFTWGLRWHWSLIADFLLRRSAQYYVSLRQVSNHQSQSQVLFCTCCMRGTVLKELIDYLWK